VKNMKLLKIREKHFWTTCDMCRYFKPTIKHQIGKLKQDLCSECVRKINRILAEIKEE